MIDQLSVLSDLQWAILMAKIRVYRRSVMFSDMRKFDEELRPRGSFVDYPDALYLLTEEDFKRAAESVRVE